MELDLALDREEGALQASESGDLLDETVWLQQLEHWLKIVCRDESLDCPTLVRSAEELSLGLRFTDDANIADLNSAWRQKTGPTDVLSFAALDDAGDWMEAPASNWETSSFPWRRPGVRPRSRGTACNRNCAGW